MTDPARPALSPLPVPENQPMLNALTRQRLGQQLQEMYDPVIDEALDPRLAELLQQLDRDRDA